MEKQTLNKYSDKQSTDVANVTGVMFNYYFVCHTKLWLFAHDIQMEQESDLVALGKLTHEEHYARDNKEIALEGDPSASSGQALFQKGHLLAGIKLDRITPDGYIHEIKKSDIAESAHVWQLKYYLWVLQQNGFGSLTGVLEFPKQRKRREVRLTTEDENSIEQKIEAIKKVVQQPHPPKAEKIGFCRQCSYRELCWC